MKDNKIFYSFLSVACPEIATKFKRRGECYETYFPIQKYGHKCFYDLKKQMITHMFLKSTFNGYEYGAKTVIENYIVEKNDNGVKLIKKSSQEEVVA